MRRPEEALQRAVVQLLALYAGRGLLAFAHVPNGGYRTPAEAGRLRAMGTTAGVPDLLVWLAGGRSFSVEMKAGKGSLSGRQADWGRVMAGLGHRVYVCRSLDEVEAVLRAEGVPEIGKIAVGASLSAVKPLAGVCEPPEAKAHQAPLKRLSGGIP